MPEIGILVSEGKSSREWGVFNNASKSSPVKIDSENLKDNWREFCGVMEEVFYLSPRMSEFSVCENTIAVSVSGEGKIQFIAGVSASTKNNTTDQDYA